MAATFDATTPLRPRSEMRGRICAPLPSAVARFAPPVLGRARTSLAFSGSLLPSRRAGVWCSSRARNTRRYAVTHSDGLAERLQQFPHCGETVVGRRRTTRWCSESCRVVWCEKARHVRQEAEGSRNKGDCALRRRPDAPTGTESPNSVSCDLPCAETTHRRVLPARIATAVESGLA
jgi:hypothetical protein